MKILMLEDQPYFAGLIVGMLEGLDIDVVESLADAKTYLSCQKYDMMLVDLNVPDSRGLDTLRELKEYKVPKVVLTGQFEVSKDVIQYGVQDFLIKNDVSMIYERIMFNVAKVKKNKRPRFAPETFEQIKACFEINRCLEAELTAV